MLNGRIYRAAFVPLLFALVIAGFSLTGRVAPLSSSLAPDAFEGGRAYAELQALAERFPERRPGSVGDQQLAAYVAHALRALGSPAKGGFAVTTHSFRAQTIDGERTLATVIAQRPGTTGEAPIVVLAHRDAAGRGARAELSGTVALLELARVLAASETQRTIVLVSTSGGSGGNAGAADFAAHADELVSGGRDGGAEEADEEGKSAAPPVGGPGRPLDAALVLGDLAGTGASAPQVVPFATSGGSAPAQLQSTAEAAVAQQTALAGGGSATLAQLAHLVFPLAGGEQAPLGASGVPAVLVGVGGERPPAANQPVSAARLEALGRAALATIYALDGGPEIASGPERGLPVEHKAIPAWALRLLVGALLLPALLTLGDGLARLRRRREPVGRWVAWSLACCLPFLGCAAFTILLGRSGAIPAPPPPVSPAALPFDGTALEATLASALVLVLAWLAWPALMRRLALPVRPHGDAAALGMLLVLGGLALVVWVFDPLTALLLAPALHLWLVLTSAPLASGWERRGAAGARARALALVGLGVLPLALLVAFYAHQLDLGLGGVVHTALLLLAGGRIGLGGALLWSIAYGCLAAAVLVALAPRATGEDDAGEPVDPLGEREPIAIRGGWAGSKSYAGPGSLGGTESALRW